MKRRAFIGAVPFALCAVPGAARAQPAGRVYRLGILHPGTLPPPSDPILVNGFTAPLRELGYVEGQNLVVERRYADGKLERLPGLARALIDSRVEVILAVGSAATKAIGAATTTTPIVFLTNGDPVATGLVQSLARPGRNVTGVLITPEGTLAGKKVELLRELVPRVTKMALLSATVSESTSWQVQETRAAASAPGLELEVVEVNGGDYVRAFAVVAAGRAQALVVGAHPFFLRDRKVIIELAAQHRLPAIYEWPRQVKDGGLMSYGANDVETYAQVASYIDRTFKGTPPSNMPIWQPSTLHLVVNRRTAEALGLTLPPTLLLRADEVIE